jgi:hypothetical protein
MQNKNKEKHLWGKHKQFFIFSTKTPFKSFPNPRKPPKPTPDPRNARQRGQKARLSRPGQKVRKGMIFVFCLPCFSDRPVSGSLNGSGGRVEQKNASIAFRQKAI